MNGYGRSSNTPFRYDIRRNMLALRRSVGGAAIAIAGVQNF